MFGIIGFNQHKIRCIIGTYPEERESEQEIYVDLRVEVDFSKCATTDNIRDTVDYVHLANLCTYIAQTRKHKLIETFAYEVIYKLSEDPRISWSWIKVEKPQAIISATSAMVELSKGQRQGK